MKGAWHRATPACAYGINSNRDLIKIKSWLYSWYYAEACNESPDPSPRRRAWATQLRRNVVAVASRWQHCADLTEPGFEPYTSPAPIARALSS